MVEENHRIRHWGQGRGAALERVEG